MEHPVTRAEFEALKESVSRIEEIYKAEFKSFKDSVRGFVDSLNKKMNFLIQKYENSDLTSQNLQRCNDDKGSLSVEIGVDGPTRAGDMIEIEGIQHGDREGM